MKSDDFGGPAPPCAGLGQGLEISVQKNQFQEFLPVLPGATFRGILKFLTVHFSVIFEVTSDSKL